MPTMIIFHETDNVGHWAKAWRQGAGSRHEMFDAIGVKCRSFRDPDDHNTAGVLLEIPDLAAFENFMKSDAAMEAMKEDGVKIETLRRLVEFIP